MRFKIQSLLNNSQFFSIVNSTNNRITYTLETPSQILLRNIYLNWLRYLHLKTHKLMPIFIHKTAEDFHKKIKALSLPFGIIYHEESVFKNNNFQYTYDAPCKEKNSLQLQLKIPQQDFMQYFIQWQRYRKYWWSSITTTPSLFAIGDIKQHDNEAEVDIVAKLPYGDQTVEHIAVKNRDCDHKDNACLICSMSLEKALFILLLDGMNSDPNDEYLRLHRTIAPYKMSFALNFEDLVTKQNLKDLAALLFHRLSLEKVSANLPDFSISLDEQLSTNLKMGIPYTAILEKSTLEDGILHLLNSSTMLREQLHIADFHTYAALICNAK